MELKKFKINGKAIEFVNAYRNTRSGFAHDSTIFINNCQYGTATCIYYNRTWERYCYQSVMRKLVRQLEDERIERLKNRFKEVHGYTKLTSKRTEEFEAEIKDDSELKLYAKLFKALS
jgi:hypothetical protein